MLAENTKKGKLQSGGHSLGALRLAHARPTLARLPEGRKRYMRRTRLSIRTMRARLS